MENLDYWRLCDELTVIQAALLIAGIDPSSESAVYAEECKAHERPHGYEAAKAAITVALRREAVSGFAAPVYIYDINGNECGTVGNEIDIKRSMVDVESLRKWLKDRGIRTGFFFPTAIDAPDYLDPRNSRYAPKLAAAVRAWQSVTDQSGKTPKQALQKWLREHAAAYGMTNDDGNPSESAIEDAAKVANWNPSGGAPKTPGG